jgi:hypothetical protein
MSYNSETKDSVYNSEKRSLLDMDLIGLLIYYKRKDNMSEIFFNNYLYLLCLKLENTQDEILSTVIHEKHKETFSLILNYRKSQRRSAPCREISEIFNEEWHGLLL